MWDRLHGSYVIRDPSDIEQLLQICQTLDLVETGDIAAREALAGRNFIVKVLRNLFPDDEERRRRPGRPPNAGSW